MAIGNRTIRYFFAVTVSTISSALIFSSVATGGGGTGRYVSPTPAGRIVGIAEIRGGKNGGGVGVPDHLGQISW